MTIKLTLTNKWLYSLLILVTFLVLGVGVWAYQSTLPPSVFGHTGNEIDITINGETKLLSEFLTSGELGSSTTIVRHSQTTTTPECNAGWTKLWEGYSLKGMSLTSGMVAGQDLGSTGSCLKELYPIPFVECSNVKDCDYYTGGDYSMWLSARDSNTGPLSGMSNIEPIISKCSVCEKTTPVIVLHSQTATAPECNAGWTKLWEGYSLAGTFLSVNVGSGQDLGSTGSCLEKLYPIPFVECSNVKNCDYYTGQDYAMWLSARDSNTGPLSGTSNIEPIISKCSVCSK